MEDASIEDFLDESGQADASEQVPDNEGESDATEGVDTAGTEHEVSDTTTTYEWSPSGVDCAACGATVNRRWRDGDRVVCAECKEW